MIEHDRGRLHLLEHHSLVARQRQRHANGPHEVVAHAHETTEPNGSEAVILRRDFGWDLVTGERDRAAHSHVELDTEGERSLRGARTRDIVDDLQDLPNAEAQVIGLRQLVRDGRIVRLRIAISDRPGALAAVAQIIAKHQGYIVDVQHQRMFLDVPAKLAELDFVVETRDGEHVDEIVNGITAAGYPIKVLTDAS